MHPPFVRQYAAASRQTDEEAAQELGKAYMAKDADALWKAFERTGMLMDHVLAAYTSKVKGPGTLTWKDMGDVLHELKGEIPE